MKKRIHIVSLVFLLGLAPLFAGGAPKANDTNSQRKDSHKEESKAEKKNFKQHLKEERAACKHHRHTVACNDLKERQRIEKRQFKAGEKTVQGAEASRRG